MNNPLKYTDPSGEIIFAVLLPILIKAAIVGAGIGAASYTASVGLSNGGFNNWNTGQFFKSVGIGAISGAVTAGIGQAFGGVSGFGNELDRAFTHGFANGAISDLTGGDFGSGFLAGSLGSLAGSGFQAVGHDFALSGVGTIGFSALSGGIGEELGGGSFWHGAGTGAIVAGLNHLGNHLADGPKKPSLKDMKDNPPTDPEYKAPKSGPRKVLTPRGKGWVDDKGNVWVPSDNKGNHAPHWDVQLPKGGYKNVYLSISTSLKAGAGVGVGFGIWEGAKWLTAVLGAPETGGTSLVLLGIP